MSPGLAFVLPIASGPLGLPALVLLPLPPLGLEPATLLLPAVGLPLPALPAGAPPLPLPVPAVATIGLPAAPAPGTVVVAPAALFEPPAVPGLVLGASLPQPASPAAIVKLTRVSEVGRRRTGSPSVEGAMDGKQQLPSGRGV